MRILKDDAILLVIDIQERLLPHISGNEELIARTKILMEGMKVLQVPVLLTEQYPKGLGATVNEIKEHMGHFNPLEKMTFSCCDDAGFMSALKKSGKKNILICGIESHVCVLQTVLDLLENGYYPVVIEDCTSSRKMEDKLTALARIRQEGGIISSSESILFELARVSGTPEFKAISKLVK